MATTNTPVPAEIEEPVSGLVGLGMQPKIKPAPQPEDVQDARAAARAKIAEVKVGLDNAFEEAFGLLKDEDHRIIAGFRSTLGFCRGHLQGWEG